jgi:uncharacterized membrane protein YbhN (UPF0104 family)
MGIGGGIFLVALGAIIAFAVHARFSWLDVQAVGWILMLAGFTVLGLTLWFWRDRRRQKRLTLVETSQIERQHGAIPADLDKELRLPPM